MRLSCLKVGETSTVTGIDTKSSLLHRFYDLGIIDGTKIKCLYKSPLGDPSAYLVKNKIFAIRQKDANSVFIK